jgi:ferritin-like metal-binding protein YciE
MYNIPIEIHMQYKDIFIKKLKESYEMEKTVMRLLEKQTQSSLNYIKVNKSIIALLKESRKQMDQIDLMIKNSL